jgi:hypothetical protein
MGLSELLSAALRSRSTTAVHRGSQRVWPAILTAAAVAAMTTGGCVFHDDDERRHHDDEWEDDDGTPPVQPPDQPEDPMLLTIDTDQIIEAEPGEGVGLFVEYAAGGFWRMWTSCDTNYSGQACQFDACVSIVNGSSDIRLAEGEELEGSDRIELLSDGWTCLSAETDADLDGLLFETEPGAVVRFEVSLDGFLDGRYVYWVGDGVLHAGAPTNPVDFVPTSL